MTRDEHDEAVAAYDDASKRFGDALMADPPDRAAYDKAHDALTQAARVLRGVPRTLAGITNTGRTA